MHVTNTDSDTKIAVTAITGFLGSGKTRYINQLLQQTDGANTVVIVNEIGQLGIDQASWSFVQPSVILLEGGCLCCQMQGSLSVTLQRLFTDALARKIPRFSQILVETSGLADPSALRFTLHTDFFLKERFVYNGCICIVDVVNAQKQAGFVEWSRQLVQADLVLLSHTDIASDEQTCRSVRHIAMVTDAPLMDIPAFLSAHAPDSRLRLMSVSPMPRKAGASMPFLSRYLEHGAQTSSSSTLTNTAKVPRQRPVISLAPVQMHSSIRIVTLEFAEPLRRSVFNRVLERMLERLGATLLRAKALLRFQGDEDAYLFNIVHAQRYPAQRLGKEAQAQQMAMVLFLDGVTDEMELPQSADFYEG